MNENPFAVEALDYLKLNAEEKIRWREERDLTLGDWFRSFKAKVTYEEDPKPPQLSDMFGTPFKLYRLIHESTFGEPIINPDNGRITLDKTIINAHLEDAGRLVPVNDIISLKQSNNNEWLVTRRYLDDEFQTETYVRFLNGKERYVSLVDAAKITKHLRKRRSRITEWKTMDDLNAESGLNFPRKAAADRYHRMNKAGKLGMHRVSIFDVDRKQGFHGSVTKIPPWDYKRVLAEDKKLARILQTHLSSRQIAKKYGIPVKGLGNKVSIAEERQLIKPVYVETPKGGSMRRLLTPEDADLIVSDELDLRPVETIQREKDFYRRMREMQGVTTTKELAELLEVDVCTTAELIRQFAKYELITPTKKVLTRNAVKGYVLAEDDVKFIQSYYVKHKPKNLDKVKFYANETLTEKDSELQNDYMYLWNQTKVGDEHSFIRLAKEYEPIINRLAKKWSTTHTFPEKQQMLQTGLYEIIMEHDVLTKKRTYHLLEHAFDKRVKEERLFNRYDIISYDDFLVNDFTRLDAIDRMLNKGATDEF